MIYVDHESGRPAAAVRVEFAGVDLGDARRARRAVAIAERLAANPEASVPDAMGERAITEAAYRHLSSDAVTMAALLEPHILRTAGRAAQAGVAFAVSDTTEFKFGGDKARDGLCPIDNAQGFLSHVTIAVSADGRRTPFGLLGVEAWARKEIKHTRRRKFWERRSDATRESLRWGRGIAHAARRAPDAELIHVADRDGDVYDVLAQLVEEGQRFIIRAAQDRLLEPVDRHDARHLFEAAQTSPTRYALEVPISARRDGGNTRPPDMKRRHPGRGHRLAYLSFAARAVTLKRPRRSSPELPQKLTIEIVHVLELGPPLGQAAVEWILLTGEPIDTPDAIAFLVEGYRPRWVIEEYFKAIKTGCAFESKQLVSFRTLTNMLAFVMVVAYALLLMRTLTNSGETEPAAALQSSQQAEILRACSSVALPRDMTVRDALLAIAGLGGHLPNNGYPGWRVISRGWRTLLDYERGFNVAAALNGPERTPQGKRGALCRMSG